MKRIVFTLAAAFACALAAASLAGGAGPSPGISQGWEGLTRGDVRYVAVPSGRTTSVQSIDRNGVRRLSLKGAWGIPIVAFDGTTEGLLPDGRTLLLAQSLFSGQTLRTTTTFT